mmetsp:Transcript_14824/g.40683  ORF Transcript_14824/g.40683 Transcript_14824/m.40683 type:complete len:358 (-) Transcript_14824:64-1137(-)
MLCCCLGGPHSEAVPVRDLLVAQSLQGSLAVGSRSATAGLSPVETCEAAATAGVEAPAVEAHALPQAEGGLVAGETKQERQSVALPAEDSKRRPAVNTAGDEDRSLAASLVVEVDDNPAEAGDENELEDEPPACCRLFPGHTVTNQDVRCLSRKNRRMIDDFFHAEKNYPWQPVSMLFGSKATKRYSASIEGSPLKLFKGVSVVEASVGEFFQFMADIPNFKRTMAIADTMFVDGASVGHMEAHHATMQLSFKMPMGIPYRDFCLENLVVMLDEGTVLSLAQSVERLDVPEKPPFVRGTVLASGYLAKSIGQNRCELTYVVQVDPKGWLPKWVVNLVAVDQTDNVTRIADYFKTRKR